MIANILLRPLTWPIIGVVRLLYWLDDVRDAVHRLEQGEAAEPDDRWNIGVAVALMLPLTMGVLWLWMTLLMAFGPGDIGMRP